MNSDTQAQFIAEVDKKRDLLVQEIMRNVELALDFSFQDAQAHLAVVIPKLNELVALQKKEERILGTKRDVVEQEVEVEQQLRTLIKRFSTEKDFAAQQLWISTIAEKVNDLRAAAKREDEAVRAKQS